MARNIFDSLKPKHQITNSIHQLKNLVKIYGTNYSLLNQILAHIITLGIFPQNYFACRILDAYAKIKKLPEARKVFDKMLQPDVSSWTSLLNLYINFQQPFSTLMLFSELVVSVDPKPDSHSVVAALSACARTKDVINGRIIHGMVYKYLERPRISVYNGLIDMYGKCKRVDLAQRVFDGICFKDVGIWTCLVNGYVLSGDMESGMRVFDEMPERNVVSWTAMITGFVHERCVVEAFKFFIRMRNEDDGECCVPNAFTIVALLSGCADVGALDLGSSIHGYINKRYGFVSDVAVNNGLIDMYGKNGNLDSAVKLFDSLKKKDLFSWTSMISSFALHGKGDTALLVYHSMLESGLTPNNITFLSLLSACSHAGLVYEGERLFDKFISDYNIKPQIEHFGCMVDLFVRAGCLEKALTLIESMPMKPDAAIWRSILVASIEHGNLELADIAGKKVLELEPDDEVAYVLLWNLYRSENRLEDALRVIKMMRGKRLKKTPGCSWIELNGVVHEFLAEPYGYHQTVDMMFVLDGMAKQSKLDVDQLFIVIWDH